MNLDKLDQAIAYIEANPEEHDQSAWFARGSCGTTACLAGTVAVLNGWTPEWSAPRAYSTDFVSKDGERRHVASAGAEILDLYPEDADALFLGAQDLDEIKAIRTALAAGQPGRSALPDGFGAGELL